MPTTAPYGSWKSPISTDLITQKIVGLAWPSFDGDDIYWTETRPTEGGRTVIVRRTPDGKVTDVTPRDFNARTRVHEYGGKPYLCDHRTIYFSNWNDQRVYRQEPNAAPRPITPLPCWYADFCVDRKRNRMFCVREDHRGNRGAAKEGGAAVPPVATDCPPDEVVNTLVALDLNDNSDGGRVVLSGNDFYSTPRISPDGAKICWLTWNHPNLPWDGTELWVANIDNDGLLKDAQLVAGGKTESIFQPEWSPDGVLHFISDRTGWWNLYRWRGGRIEPLCPMNADFGLPLWNFGMRTYAFETPTRIICTYTEKGVRRLARLDTVSGKLQLIETPFTEIGSPHAHNGKLLFIGASPTEPACVVLHDLATGKHEILKRSTGLKVDAGYISIPRPIEFPTEDGKTAHAYFYAPKNKDFVAPDGEKPPLIVMSHGGPTSSASTAFNLGVQYWTSRGFGVVDVNYGGSTGYGREYWQRLVGQWGVVDVDDCVNAAKYLVARGEADEKRCAIRGGSAGGYTTLCALTFRDFFRAGASHFGLAELEIFVKDTHKFESRYLESLIGPYPEKRELYRERSPLFHADRITAPLILFQGLEDKVVPPNQHRMIFEAVRNKGIPCATFEFEGEQHGFRKAETIKRVLEAELYFYSRMFGFELAEKIEPVKIENLG
jgi:dipeptidyl aminopeptidase/acylaminoacyl peptidase